MVSVDRVYQTVQRILNKEQRGYLPPVEFNLFANQVQIEIFEQYFYDQAQFMRVPRMDTDYADIVNNIDEKIEIFERDALVDTIVLGETVREIHQYPEDFYRLGVVTVSDIILDEVSRKEAAYVNLSPLTAPTTTQPVYVRHENGIAVYPQEGLSVVMNYITIPTEVAWGYINVSGKATYNATTSIDFQLHASELPELVIKICSLAGVAIRAVDVTQLMQGEEQQMTAQEKQ